MKTFLLPLLNIIVLLSFFSCAGVKPAVQPAVQPEVQPDVQPEIIIEKPPVITEKPEIPSYIMSQGKVSALKLSTFLLLNNQHINPAYAADLVQFYIEEAFFEGVNHDIAFAQMCLETGFLRFGGDVKPEQFNFAGLGAIGGGEPGLSFPDPRTGVRAQIQHLKAYGSEEPLKGTLVNPRFRFVRRGSAPTIEGLAGTWAADRQYAVKINTILQRIYDYSFD
ncbi:MAG: glucosaminidase domain-containing protein [Treponema sp.]|nr:glucosaminidase domain-containing protein [Treponema sp.]